MDGELFSLILRLPGLAPAIADQVGKLKGKPKNAEKNILRAYVRRLDERRVFVRDHNAEVIEACVASPGGGPALHR